MNSMHNIYHFFLTCRFSKREFYLILNGILYEVLGLGVYEMYVGMYVFLYFKPIFYDKKYYKQVRTKLKMTMTMTRNHVARREQKIRILDCA